MFDVLDFNNFVFDFEMIGEDNNQSISNNFAKLKANMNPNKANLNTMDADVATILTGDGTADTYRTKYFSIGEIINDF